MGAGKLFHMKFHDERGFDSYLTKASGLRPDKSSPDYNAKPISFGPVATDDDYEIQDTKFTVAVIEDLEKHKDEPFFLSLGLKKPHMPWNAPQKYFDMYDLEKIELPEVPADDLDDLPAIARYIAGPGVHHPFVEGGTHEYMSADPMLWKRAVRAYLATSTFADANVGRMIDALKKSGQYDNTVIVLWGDHGWHLGEKNHWRKHALWERSTKTTFIMRVPGLTTPGARCSSVVSLSDIYPTLVELCNLPKRDVAGNSLVPLLKDAEKKVLNPALMQLGPGNYSVRYDQWRYTRYRDGSEELYNQSIDPDEFNNVAGNPEFAETKELLKKYIPTEEAPDPAGEKSAFEVLKRFEAEP
ncbi:MAG: sulfatase-like hydrolase/transferase, partial [Pontiella sp.]|nr:sulfatase-like hydrolase/transferase [Pontiella sp.]